jgi:2-dehydro-3-deoxygalactonokinase
MSETLRKRNSALLAITIDTGTTNTRATAWLNGQVIAKASAEVGVRDTAITGNCRKLRAAVKQTMMEAAAAAGAELSAVGVIVASGMITSDMGLLQVPHIVAPAGIGELAAGMLQSSIPEIALQPIWFVPGIKNSAALADIADYEAMDIMRGEEAEAFGLIDNLKLQGPAIFVFPGSHSKFMTIDKSNRITACLTTLAGELLDNISRHTILASAVGNAFVHELDTAMLLEGARCSALIGLSRACFSVRILEQFSKTTAEQRANFLLGAVLAQDVFALKRSSAIRLNPDVPIFITGKKVMKQAFSALFQSDRFFNAAVTAVDDKLSADLAGRGAIAIARRRGLMEESQSQSRGK